MATIARIIGTASIRLTLDNKGFTAAVQAAVREAAAAAKAKIDVDVDDDLLRKKIENSTRRIRPKIEPDLDQSIFRKLEGLSSAIRKIPRIALGIAGVSTAITAIAGIGAAIAQLSGVVALLPAGLLAAGAAFGVLAIGTQGFGDALKAIGDPAKFSEAIKNLAPSAQEAAKAVQSLQPAWKSLQLDVQQRLFDGLGTRISALGNNFLPVLKTGLGGVATELNSGIRMWADWANQGQQVGALQGILDKVRGFFANLAPAGRDFAAALTDIASVGSGFLPSFGTGIANAAASFRQFIESAKNSGALQKFIQTGITAFQQLGTIIGNIISIAGQIFSGLQTSGAGFLATLVTLTETVKNFFASLQGQQTLASLGAVLSSISTTVGTVLNVALRSIGPIIVALAPFIQQLVQSLGTALVGAIQAVSPIILSMAKFFSENASAIVPLVIAIGGLIAAIGPIAGIIRGVTTAWLIYNAIIDSAILKTVAGWISMGTQASINAAKMVAGWASASASAIASVAVQVGQWVLLGAQAAIGAAKVAAAWVLQKVEAAGALIAQLPAFAAIVAGWISMGAQALIQGARIAAAWLLSLGPIGIIIAAVVGLVAIIISNWDAIYNFIVSIGGKIGSFFSSMWSSITGFFRSAWEGLKSIVSNGINGVIDFVRSLPGRILSALGNLGSLLINAGKAILDGFLQGLKNAWKAVTDFVGGIGRWISDHKGPLSYDRQLLVPAGLAIMEGLHEGLQTGFDPIMNTVSGMADQLVGAFGAPDIGAGISVNDLRPAVNGAADLGGIGVQPVLNQYNVMQPGTDVRQFSQTVLQRGMSDFLNGASTLSVTRQGVQAGVNDQLVNGVAR